MRDQHVEVVERKGIGHPDPLCDGIAESVSRAIGTAYMEEFGRLLHYNTDEVQLVGGKAAPEFGGGKMVDPIYILVAGRATREHDGTMIPVRKLALDAAREYVQETIPTLEVGSDVVVDVRLHEGSDDLQSVFADDGRGIPTANDTSVGMGHAPLTDAEKLVLRTEASLNGDYGERNPAIGYDVKVMAKRVGDDIELTLAVPLVDEHVPDMETYRSTMRAVEDHVRTLSRDVTDKDVDVHLNTGDDYDSGSVYLTVTGTSAEQGDDGSVGRGNRANGLITFNRPMSMEATSGKNAFNHVGKVYNLLSDELAADVVERVEGIRELQTKLLAQVGQPIDRPHLAEARVVTDDTTDLAEIEADIETVVDEWLANVTDISERSLNGELSTF